MNRGSLFSLSGGRFTTSVVDGVWQPRTRLSKAPVVYMHGAGAANASQANDATAYFAQHRLLRAIAEEGHVVVCPTATNTWGNATSLNRIAEALDHARTVLGAEGPAVLIGGSHGGAAVLNYAASNPEDVACVIGLLGLVDLDSVRDGNLLGMRASIDAAWAVVYPAVLPDGANPADNAGDFSGTVSIQWWYALSDDVVLPETVEAFGALSGADLRPVEGGHTDAAGRLVSVGDVLEFINLHTMEVV